MPFLGGWRGRGQSSLSCVARNAEKTLINQLFNHSFLETTQNRGFVLLRIKRKMFSVQDYYIRTFRNISRHFRRFLDIILPEKTFSRSHTQKKKLKLKNQFLKKKYFPIFRVNSALLTPRAIGVSENLDHLRILGLGWLAGIFVF